MEKPAQILTFEEINILGNIINYSFGAASTRDAGYGITTSLGGNLLTLKYATVVHFNSSDGLATQKKEHERQSNEMLNKKLADVKADFREQSGRALKIKEVSNKDDVELISATAYSERKIAYYRRAIVFEIS
ncbi:MAG: hypothetical protein CBB97_24175 [Candidatus Endolissoclinum sp. TMED37]|nr:MAG: hypothetical protein CBB97_24175 [Candidatus Endolissoclinum sp. TMED37]|tara:strand:+ start:2385 stop:2780 length:396 start_codon:yes stop_codon:yes gene_type:complete